MGGLARRGPGANSPCGSSPEHCRPLQAAAQAQFCSLDKFARSRLCF